MSCLWPHVLQIAQFEDGKDFPVHLQTGSQVPVLILPCGGLWFELQMKAPLLPGKVFLTAGLLTVFTEGDCDQSEKQQCP